MKIRITKTSNHDFREVKEITTLEELVAMAKDDNLIIEIPWGRIDPEDLGIDLWIEIYDEYRE